MISRAIRGKGFGGLRNYLVQQEGAEILELQGVLSVETAPKEMHAVARMSEAVAKPVYHRFFRLADTDRPLSDAQWRGVVAHIADELGLAEHQRVVIRHGNDHVHVIWNRVHPETGRAAPLRNDYAAVEKALRVLEMEHGLRVVPGRHSWREAGAHMPPPPKVSEGEIRAEMRTDRVPFARIVEGRAHAILTAGIAERTGWDGLADRLTAIGLRIEPFRQGLVLTDGVERVGLSKLRGAETDAAVVTRRKLEVAFGQGFAEWRKGIVLAGEYVPELKHRTPRPPRSTPRQGPLRTDYERALATDLRFEARQALWREYETHCAAVRREIQQNGPEVSWHDERLNRRLEHGRMTEDHRAQRSAIYKATSRGVIRFVLLSYEKGRQARQRRNLRRQQHKRWEVTRTQLRTQRPPTWHEFVAQRAQAGNVAAQAVLRGFRYAGLRAAKAQTDSRDVDVILSAVTKSRATFTGRDLAAEIRKVAGSETEQKALISAVMRSPELVALRDPVTGGLAGRFTTHQIRVQETIGVQNAESLATSRTHVVRRELAEEIAARTTMRADQLEAYRHIVYGPDLVLVEGKAGTGKSFMLGHARRALQGLESGYDVIGLAPTNAVAQDMARDGFGRAMTAHAFLADHDRDSPIARLTRNSVVMLDEGGMVDTPTLMDITRRVRDAGAKLVIVKDDKQLQSVTYGGLAAEFGRRFGTVALTEVTRQRATVLDVLVHTRQATDFKQARQIADRMTSAERDSFVENHGKAVEDAGAVLGRKAAELLGSYRFREALQLLDQAGALRFVRDREAAIAGVAAQWETSAAAHPDWTRQASSFTHDTVDAVGNAIRAAERLRTDAPPAEHELLIRTKSGELEKTRFAVGDRVQFTENDKKAGIYNGNLGTIISIDAGQVRVRLDDQRGTVEFSNHMHAKGDTYFPSTIQPGTPPHVGVVTTIEDGRAIIDFDDGRRLSLQQGFAGFRPGYSGTIHTEQGKTLDANYPIFEKGVDAALAYVGLTRYRHELVAYVTAAYARDIDELANKLEKAAMSAQKKASVAYDAKAPVPTVTPAAEHLSATLVSGPIPAAASVQPPVIATPAPSPVKVDLFEHYQACRREARRTPNIGNEQEMAYARVRSAAFAVLADPEALAKATAAGLRSAVETSSRLKDAVKAAAVRTAIGTLKGVARSAVSELSMMLSGPPVVDVAGRAALENHMNMAESMSRQADIAHDLGRQVHESAHTELSPNTPSSGIKLGL
jgi:ATP-dependent exoDNAse (exonuclease V) alpha subunit